MSNFEMSIPHHLTQEAALAKIKGLLSDAKKEHGDKISNLTENWNDNVGEFAFSIMGFAVSGTLTVTASTVDLSAELPFAATMFKGAIKSMIEERAEQILKS